MRMNRHAMICTYGVMKLKHGVMQLKNLVMKVANAVMKSMQFVMKTSHGVMELHGTGADQWSLANGVGHSQISEEINSDTWQPIQPSYPTARSTLCTEA